MVLHRINIKGECGSSGRCRAALLACNVHPKISDGCVFVDKASDCWHEFVSTRFAEPEQMQLRPARPSAQPTEKRGCGGCKRSKD